MVLKPKDRDELLIRLDERTANIYHMTEKQEQHLAIQNTRLEQHDKDIASTKTSIKWIIRILGSAGLISGLGAGLWRVFD